MSEFQYVAFRAIDRPLSDAALEFMRKQSTRATISRWNFENEYHYGDFRGDAEEMLRRGYDVHLHYANFGIRRLMIRFPHGLPTAAAAKPYLGKNGLRLRRDKSGPGATLSIEPENEPGDLDELWDFGELLDGLVGLRAEIQTGDLRPLYLAHLAVSRGSYCDPETTREAPVPAGLGQLTPAQVSLADLYELTPELIAAAAEQSAPPPLTESETDSLCDWIRQQPIVKKDAWLVQWLTEGEAADPRGEIQSEFQRSRGAALWPTSTAERTIAKLETAAEKIANRKQALAAKKAELQREKRLAKMVSDPASTLRTSEKLVKEGGSQSYEQAAELLAELREALSGSGQAELAEEQARKIHEKHPTLNRLKGALRRRGFIPKPMAGRKPKR